MSWNYSANYLQFEGADVGIKTSDIRCPRYLSVHVLLKNRIDQFDLPLSADCSLEFIFDLAWLVSARPITSLKGCDIFSRHLAAASDHDVHEKLAKKLERRRQNPCLQLFVVFCSIWKQGKRTDESATITMADVFANPFQRK